jgi:hypothetical protein
MRLSIVLFVICSSLFSCSTNKNPDVSNIKINLTTERFEKDFFDTTSYNLLTYLKQLNTNTPSFVNNYLTEILNVDPTWPTDTASAYVNSFINAYRPVYDSVEKIFNDFTPYENEIKKGLQFVAHYFPQYKAPRKIITYIGPIDGYGDILDQDAFIVGLQHHLGRNSQFYKSEMVQQTYPPYISQRFEPDYIPVNCLKNIVNDLYPEKQNDKPLVNQMIEKGKRLYLLNMFLPTTEEYKLIGYTQDQLKDSYAHEAVIWDLFIKNSLLQITEKNTVKNYIDEGPKTQELGEGAPGNIGSFAGWQIVKKYMQKKPNVTLQELMNLDTDIIFQEAKYKP